MGSAMRRLLDRFFGSFDGTRSAYPIAVFRIAFFSGLAIHFFPSLIWLDEGYRTGAPRTNEWNSWLFLQGLRLPHAEVRLLSGVTMAACVAAIAGIYPRVAAAVCGVGFFAFASFNGLHLQTLALVEAWAVLLLWMVCGGGARVLSLEAVLRKSGVPAVEPRLLSNLVLYQILLGVFFAGVEKVLAGCPWSNEMGLLLAYPRGSMVRDWVAAAGFMQRPIVGGVLSVVHALRRARVSDRAALQADAPRGPRRLRGVLPRHRRDAGGPAALLLHVRVRRAARSRRLGGGPRPHPGNARVDHRCSPRRRRAAA